MASASEHDAEGTKLLCDVRIGPGNENVRSLCACCLLDPHEPFSPTRRLVKPVDCRCPFRGESGAEQLMGYMTSGRVCGSFEL